MNRRGAAPGAAPGAATARLRLLGGLARLLRSDPGAATVEQAVSRGASVKHLIESLGIPHTEVGGVSIDGDEIALDAPAETLAASGVRLDVSPPEPSSADPSDPPTFLADTHLQALARRLRLLGFDTLIADGEAADAEIAARAELEDRILLTRDRGLLMHRRVRKGQLVRAAHPGSQLEEVVARYGLRPAFRAFTRCLECNAPLRAASRQEAASVVPPRVGESHDTFTRCSGCGRVYWAGTHWARLREFVSKLET